jgi:peptidyl-prolyl cis-trans isomerase B (cyclophilin B)
VYYAVLFILLVLGFGVIGTALAQSDDQNCRISDNNSDCVVIFHVIDGDLVIELFPEDAPQTVENFLHLTETGFYDNTLFHRIIEGFMIQGGDPNTKDLSSGAGNTWGRGGPGYTIPAEFNDLKHDRGIVSMARSDHPDSGGSQFFIVHQDSHFLDGKYTVFGRIITQDSFDTLDKIASRDTIPDTNIPIAYTHTTIVSAEIIPKSDVENMLTLDEPNRTFSSMMQSDQYTNRSLDFSFAIPTGWTVEKNDREESDVGGRIITLYGPSVEGSSPIIYINVDGFQKFNPDTETAFARNSFENMVNALLERYHQLEEQGNVVLISEGPGVINGKDVYTITGTQLDFILGGEIKFKQTLFSSKSLVYGITYYNFSQNFSDEIDTYENFVSDFTIISEEKQKQNIEEAREQAEKTAEELEFATDEFGEVIFKEPEEVGGGCLIATAAFGSELAPQVQLLREIRDNTVLQTESGTSFMNGFNQFYYSFSPIIADYERENPVFKEVMKLALTPLLTSLSLLQYTEIDSESQMLGYGIGIILLNIGMYFVAPAVLITKIRSFYKLQ